ncbi:MAG: chemotaxis protein CheW [Gemmatimonadaceae bacterium]|nr:chemotaxis protein CheW [Gemmatimonadaceae bacterium]
MSTPRPPEAIPMRMPTPTQLAAILNPDAPPAPPPAILEPELPPVARAPLKSLRARLADRESVPMLVLEAGSERYVASLADVLEAVDAPDIHPLPRMSGATRGVLPLRGALVTVLDPSRVLGHPAVRGDAALVVSHAGGRLAVLVDDVLDAMTLEPSAVRTVPSALAADRVLIGAVPHDGRLAGILDLAALLDAALALADR